MGLPARMLAPGERVVLSLHTHAAALVGPATALILLGGLLGAGTAVIPSAYRPAGQYVVVAVVAVLAWWWSVLPFLRWRSRTYTITSSRLLVREGILRRSGHTVALSRVLDVTYQRTLTDRVLGRGTLVVQTAAEGALVLDDVPGIEDVHRVLTESTAPAVPATSNWGSGPDEPTLSTGDYLPAPGPPAVSWHRR